IPQKYFQGMTSSSTNGKSTTSEVIVTEYQFERNNDYNRKILEDNYVYIPYRYYQPLVQSGLMEQFIRIILNVNEKLFNSKRSRYNSGDDNDEPDHKHQRILEEINLPISILSTPPTPTNTERSIIIDEDF
ncbi:unnamed protein product, partial [Rotaria magnacalcarata]